jgi:hypothetical protein
MNQQDLGLLSKELEASDFGNLHLTKRFEKLVDAIMQNPGESFPDIFPNEADLEGAYRFLRNDNVDWKQVLAPHMAVTVKRAETCGDILALHDTTDFQFKGEQRREGLGFLNQTASQGFFGHFALAVSSDESRLPLGVLGLETYSRHGEPKRIKYDRWATDKESLRWERLANETHDLLHGRAKITHVMDSEADNYALFEALCAREGQDFVIRLCHNRTIKQKPRATISDVLAGQTVVCEREVPLSRRSKKQAHNSSRYCARQKRVARLCFKASPVEIKCPHQVKAKYTKSLTLNIIQVQELNPPAGEDRIEWRLLTTKPVDTSQQILGIVDIYRARWLIEEYFKVLKTGCKYEQRQLESYQTLLMALALFVPVAHRLLLLRNLSRASEHLSAAILLTPDQIKLLQVLPETKLKSAPTLRDALLAIARFGGHIKNNGDPGWLTLWRGYRKLILAEIGWKLAFQQKSDQ